MAPNRKEELSQFLLDKPLLPTPRVEPTKEESKRMFENSLKTCVSNYLLEYGFTTEQLSGLSLNEMISASWEVFQMNKKAKQ